MTKHKNNTTANKAKNGESLPNDEADKTEGGLTTADNVGIEGGDNVPTGKPAGKSEAKQEAAFQATANKIKAMLDAQDKVGVFIPLENGEPKGTQLPVEINGYRMNVPKGVPNVQVPKSVADIIWQSLGIYDEASAALRSANDGNRPLRLDLQNANDRSNLDS